MVCFPPFANQTYEAEMRKTDIITKYHTKLLCNSCHIAWWPIAWCCITWCHIARCKVWFTTQYGDGESAVFGGNPPFFETCSFVFSVKGNKLYTCSETLFYGYFSYSVPEPWKWKKIFWDWCNLAQVKHKKKTASLEAALFSMQQDTCSEKKAGSTPDLAIAELAIFTPPPYLSSSYSPTTS